MAHLNHSKESQNMPFLASCSDAGSCIGFHASAIGCHACRVVILMSGMSQRLAIWASMNVWVLPLSTNPSRHSKRFPTLVVFPSLVPPEHSKRFSLWPLLSPPLLWVLPSHQILCFLFMWLPPPILIFHGGAFLFNLLNFSVMSAIVGSPRHWHSSSSKWAHSISSCQVCHPWYQVSAFSPKNMAANSNFCSSRTP